MSKKQLISCVLASVLLISIFYIYKSPFFNGESNTPPDLIESSETLPVIESGDPVDLNEEDLNDEALIKSYSEKIAQNNDDDDALYKRALLYQKTKQYVAATNDYTEVLRINPNSENAYYNRGLISAMSLEFKPAIKDFSAAIKLKPSNPALFNVRALVYVELDKFDLAMGDYRKALSLDPNYAKAYFNLGTLYERKTKFYEARMAYDNAIKYYAVKKDNAIDIEASDVTEAYYRRAIMNLNLGDFTAALADVNYVIEHQPKSAKAYKLRSVINSDLGNRDASIQDESRSQDLGIEDMLR